MLSPILDITLRVGCHLVYEASGPAVLLINLRPLADRRHRVLEEVLTLGNDLASDRFVDVHGNQIQRLILAKGSNVIHHDAIISASSQPDNHDITGFLNTLTPAELPPDLLRYTLPSRFCDSDRLANFAWREFGHVEHGWPRVQAISQWLNQNFRYTYLSGSPELSASDALQRGFGVCRDFAHLNVALNRTFNVPTRYVTGHLPDIGYPDPEGHMDFHAYAEVYLGGQWHTTDARFHVPRIGRIKISSGLDAIDGAFSTIYGGATLSYFNVWAYQIEKGTVSTGDPIDFSKRLDNQFSVRTDVPPQDAPRPFDR